MQGLKSVRETKAAAARADAKKYSVRDIAAHLGVSVNTYYRLENQPDNITRGQARRLADYLGCDMSDIFLA